MKTKYYRLLLKNKAWWNRNCETLYYAKKNEKWYIWGCKWENSEIEWDETFVIPSLKKLEEVKPEEMVLIGIPLL